MSERLKKMMLDRKAIARKAGAFAAAVLAAGSVVGCSAADKATNPNVPVATANTDGSSEASQNKVTDAMARQAADIAIDNVAEFAKRSRATSDGQDPSDLFEGDLHIQAGFDDQIPGNTDGSSISNFSYLIVDTEASVKGGYTTEISAQDLYSCTDMHGKIVERGKKVKAVCGVMPQDDYTLVTLKSTNKPDVSSVEKLKESLHGKASVEKVNGISVDELSSDQLQQAVDEIAES